MFISRRLRQGPRRAVRENEVSVEKEVPVIGGGAVRYAGDATDGLALELEGGERFELTRAQVRGIFERFSHWNPLNDDSARPRTSLQRFVDWAAGAGEAVLGRSLTAADAGRVLAVFMGEGLLPMGESYGGPVPAEFPQATVGACLEAMVDRTCVVEVGRRVAPVVVRRVAIEASGDPDDAQVMLELEVIDAPGFSWQGPVRFTLGSYAADIGVYPGYATAGMGGWTLVTGPALVAGIVQFSAERPERMALVREVWRVVARRPAGCAA
jgi:hypothetical protein